MKLEAQQFLDYKNWVQNEYKDKTHKVSLDLENQELLIELKEGLSSEQFKKDHDDELWKKINFWSGIHIYIYEFGKDKESGIFLEFNLYD